MIRRRKAGCVEQNVPPGRRFASESGERSSVRVSDPSKGILQSGKIALRGIYEKGIAAPSTIAGARTRLAENLERLIVAQANDLGASGSDRISHPEDRRVIVLHVNEASRMREGRCLAFVRPETESLRDHL